MKNNWLKTSLFVGVALTCFLGEAVAAAQGIVRKRMQRAGMNPDNPQEVTAWNSGINTRADYLLQQREMQAVVSLAQERAAHGGDAASTMAEYERDRTRALEAAYDRSLTLRDSHHMGKTAPHLRDDSLSAVHSRHFTTHSIEVDETDRGKARLADQASRRRDRALTNRVRLGTLNEQAKTLWENKDTFAPVLQAILIVDKIETLSGAREAVRCTVHEGGLSYVNLREVILRGPGAALVKEGSLIGLTANALDGARILHPDTRDIGTDFVILDNSPLIR